MRVVACQSRALSKALVAETVFLVRRFGVEGLRFYDGMDFAVFWPGFPKDTYLKAQLEKNNPVRGSVCQNQAPVRDPVYQNQVLEYASVKRQFVRRNAERSQRYLVFHLAGC